MRIARMPEVTHDFPSFPLVVVTLGKKRFAISVALNKRRAGLQGVQGHACQDPR